MSFNNLTVDSLFDVKVERQQKLQVRTRLCSLSLSDECVDRLCNFIFHEGDHNQQASYLRCITKTRGQVCAVVILSFCVCNKIMYAPNYAL